MEFLSNSSLADDESIAGDRVEEFVDGTDTLEDSHHMRRRLIQAQLRDTAIDASGDITNDQFDTVLEERVSSNESALMEMDEYISAMQSWRQNRDKKSSLTAQEEEEEQTINMEVYLQKLMSGIKLDADTDSRPESDAPQSQITSLLRLIDERRILAKSRQDGLWDSSAEGTVDGHVIQQEAEFRKLLSTLQHQYDVSDEPDGSLQQILTSEDGEEDVEILTAVSHKPSKSNVAINDSCSSSSRGRVLPSKDAIAAVKDDRFREIEQQVKEESRNDILLKEEQVPNLTYCVDEAELKCIFLIVQVIKSGVDLQQGVAELALSLENFTDDLDRLLR